MESTPQLNSDDRPDQRRTVIQVLLPFAMHGATGSYANNLGEVVIALQQQPPELINTFLLVHVEPGEGNRLELKPDNLGLVNATVAQLRFKGIRPLDPPEGVDPEVFKAQMWDSCDRMIRPLIDWYAYCTRSFGIRKWSLRDSFSFQAWYELPNDDTRHGHTVKGLQNASLRFTSDWEIKSDAKLKARMLHLGTLPDNYKLAITLFTEAMRALHVNDGRLAAIQAASSIEVALSYYIESRIRNHVDGLQNKRLSIRAYEDLRGDAVTLSSMLKLLFPLLLPSNVEYPKEIVDACDRVRKKRNDAIHNGAEISSLEIQGDIQEVEHLINFLIQQHELP